MQPFVSQSLTIVGFDAEKMSEQSRTALISTVAVALIRSWRAIYQNKAVRVNCVSEVFSSDKTVGAQRGKHSAEVRAFQIDSQELRMKY